MRRYNTMYDTDHRFVSDGRTPYCAECELLSWMHSGPRMPSDMHKKDWHGRYIDEEPGCTCGYNGTFRECKESRMLLDNAVTD